MEDSDEVYALCGDRNEHLVFKKKYVKRELTRFLTTCVHHLALHSAKIHGLTNEEQDLAVNAFKTPGPIPRICIDFVQDRGKLLGYEIRCQAMAAHLTSDSLRHLVLDGGILYLDEDSYTVFILRRYEVDDLERVYLEPRSANVESQLMMAINKLQRPEQITLYHTFASVDSARVVAGLLYESPGPRAPSRRASRLL